MQESIRTIRDGIKEELSQLIRETCEICHYGILSKEIDKLSSNFKATLTEWQGIRKECRNPFHNLPNRKKKNKACPDCGITEFEFIFNLNI